MDATDNRSGSRANTVFAISYIDEAIKGYTGTNEAKIARRAFELVCDIMDLDAYQTGLVRKHYERVGVDIS